MAMSHQPNLDPSAQEFRPITTTATTGYFLSPPHQPPPFFPPHPPPPPQLPHDLFFYPPSPQPQQQQQPTLAIAPAPSTTLSLLPPPAHSPTRAILISSLPPTLSESLIRRELEIFGDVRAVQMERAREGIVTVHFYDLRAAHAAHDTVRHQHMQHQHRLRIHFSNLHHHPAAAALHSLSSSSPPPPSPPPAPGIVAGKAVWAQFTLPAAHAFPDGHNQGTIVIFNLDPSVSSPTLHDIFQAFGAVKEMRETPMKKCQRFIEYYDIRDASKALMEMNQKEINGRSVMIEFSRPGGHSNKRYHNYNNSYPQNYPHHLNNSAFHYAKPHSLPPPPPPTPPQVNQGRPFSQLNRKASSNSSNSRRRRSPSSERSIEVALRKLSVDQQGSRKSGGNKNKKANANVNGAVVSSNGGSTTMKGQGGKSGKGWKGRHRSYDPRYMIKEEAIVNVSDQCNKDTRTTVMIKNIPNKYSQKLLLNMLDNHCIHCNEQINSGGGSGGDQPLSSYDFVYLPIDFNNKCNVGYGFVNMTSPEATLRLYKAFHHQHWEVFNSRKICEVTYARVQGLEALKEHFKNSKFACENDEYLPVVFSPPREGRHLTVPRPIVLAYTSTSPVHVDGGDFTSSTTPSTDPCSSEFFDHHDHDETTSNDDDQDCDSIDGGDHIIDRSCNISLTSSNGGGELNISTILGGINVYDDSNSSVSS